MILAPATPPHVMPTTAWLLAELASCSGWAPRLTANLRTQIIPTKIA